MTLFHVLRRDRETAQHPRLTICGARAGVQGYLLARLAREYGGPLLIVTPDAQQRDVLCEDLECFLAEWVGSESTWEGRAAGVCRFIPTAFSAAEAPGPSRALLTYQPLWRLLIGTPVVVVAAADALQHRVIPPHALMPRLLHLHIGTTLPMSGLAASLVELGYRRASVVETIGEFALRGGILDVFSPGQVSPFRIEFFGDDIETIRAFDASSQTSIVSLQTALIAPLHPLSRQQIDTATGWFRIQQHLQQQGWDDNQIATYCERWRQQSPSLWPWGLETFFFQETSDLLAYMPPNALLCGVDSEEILLAFQQAPSAVPMFLGTAIVSLPVTHMFPPSEVIERFQTRVDIALQRYDHDTPLTPTMTMHISGTPQFVGALERCVTQLRQWQSAGWCVLVLCRYRLEVERLKEILATYEIGAQTLAPGEVCLTTETLRPGTLLLGTGVLSQGFVWTDMRLVVLRAVDIFGDKRHDDKSVSPHKSLPRFDLEALRPGDRVVHVEYGVGLYRRMTFLELGRDAGEFMELEYAEGSKLYVPSYRLNLVQKYSGSEETNGPLSRLGSPTWARTKERVKTALLEIAAALVQLHAVRQQDIGYSFSLATPMHRDFDNGFEYVETEDQLRAIQDVITDMERPRPMERLVCGDVGYGKTEVAMRAAFKAIYDGKQVAVLVPTTVLAQQHYETFQRRFAAYPVQLGLLSRLRSRKEQQKLLQSLRQGAVDLVIGTHRLLQKDVQFKNLGLLVIDEEHRFGVGHKERIKHLSQGIDVLMLSATPIPRSLHMALVGLRDCSIIATPPEGRTAIRTVVLPFTEATVQKAIEQELARDGQIFFVHNRIEILPSLQEFLQRLVPTCRVALAHGQMPERTLETIMLRFLGREFDLLLCTTIIESGLDIPTVNTIIINHADTFGLAQLYQLRGRVGRGTQQAYAYLLIPGDTLLSTIARKRIEVLEEFSDLGAGLHLASRDLEIRGAGNLLGAQQSGHIASVGFDLYCQMMAEAVRTVRGEEILVHVEPELRLPVQGYIPESYIEEDRQRLEWYRRFSTVTDPETLEILRREVRDRFGAIPPPFSRLLMVIELKIIARQLALERIEHHGSELVLTFHPQTPVEPSYLLRWLHAMAPGFRWQSEHVVRFPWPGVAVPETDLAQLKDRLQQLQDDASIL